MMKFRQGSIRNSLEAVYEGKADQYLKEKLSEKELFTFAVYKESEAEKTGFSNYSYWHSTFQAFKKNKAAVSLVFVLAAILIFTMVQPFLPGQYDPNQVINDPSTGMQYRNIAPCREFWLGTNAIGQDLWSRIWAGTRTSLFIGFSVALIEAVIGIFVGTVWGYVRKLDFILTEIYNVLDNIPNTIILILISYILKPSIATLIFGMCLTGWIQMARFIRNQIIIIRDRDYNTASRCVGTPVFQIMMKNLLPYLVSVIMLRMALTIPEAIGNEVFITYIGLGLPAAIPSLGNLINEGRALMMSESLRYQLIYPTLILAVVAISFYIIGNVFSDAADPKNHI